MKKQKNVAAYTVEQIMELMQISKNSAYNLIHTDGFPVIKIGNIYRIPVDRFHAWLNGNVA